MRDTSGKNDHLIISNAETYNKYLLTISTSSFPTLYYMIQNKKGFILGFEIALGLFAFALIITMFTLFVTIDDPEPDKCKEKLIDFFDWAALAIFTSALGLTYYSICIY
jgi:hypothetical protein